MLFHTAPEQTIEALRLQAHSLQALSYSTNGHYMAGLQGRSHSSRVKKVAFGDGGFSDFHALERVHLIGDCKNFENAILCGRSPPKLRELTTEATHEWSFMLMKPWLALEARAGTGEYLIGHTPFLRVESPCIPESLTTFNMIYMNDESGSNEIPLHRFPRANMLKLAETMKQRFGLTLSVSYKYRNRFYPPYLHGEPVPKLTNL